MVERLDHFGPRLQRLALVLSAYFVRSVRLVHLARLGMVALHFDLVTVGFVLVLLKMVESMLLMVDLK